MSIAPADEEQVAIDYARVLEREDFKRGFIKCRLLHLAGWSVFQPDLLFGGGLFRKDFYLPRFFDPNVIAFFGSPASNFCKLQFCVEPSALIKVAFFQNDKVQTLEDGSVIYRCAYVQVDGQEQARPAGCWRRRGNEFELRLFHHTNELGYRGITTSNQLWCSRRNIQGNRWLENVGYGYFTCLPKIRGEHDLQKIAMSSSGLMGLIPTNAPYHIHYANMVQIPVEDAARRARVVKVWVSAALLSPNHLWLHRPMNRPAYYEVVLPEILRVAVQPSANLLIQRGRVVVQASDRKIFNYVIVGDADNYAGLQAPYNEEDTTNIAMLEIIQRDDDLMACWMRLANTDQHAGREVEHLRFDEVNPVSRPLDADLI